MSKATIEVKPVAWSGEKILKYEAFGRVGKTCIPSGPQPSEEKAINALEEEINKWMIATTELKELYEKTYRKGGTNEKK